MSSDDRTFTVSQIRQALSEDERQLAALQRRVDARRKMAEAAEELELAERELSSDGVAEAPPPAEQPRSSGPAKTGDRAQVILQSDPSRRWNPRQVWEQMVERGWAQETKDARTAIRVALKRLAEREERISRTEEGMTHAYQWIATDGEQFAHGSNGHAPAPSWRN